MARIIYHGHLSARMGLREETLEGSTVSQILSQIRRRDGAELSQLLRRSHILVDHRNAGLLKGFRTPVGPDSLVEFIPVCGGG